MPTTNERETIPSFQAASIFDLPDAAGAERRFLSPGEVAELDRVIHASGLAEVSLSGRDSVVFAYPGMGVGKVYPELAGCTTEVCAFIEEAAVFERHGIQVVGISTEPSEPPPGCLSIPFPTGVVQQTEVGSPLEFVEKGDRRYLVRTSFVIGPDGTGQRISEITDVVAHVRRCLDAALQQRLDRYRDAVLAYLGRGGTGIPSKATIRRLLPNGADSVVIPQVDLTLEVVAKVARSDIVAQEAGYMNHLNRLLEERGRSPLFPQVVAVSSDEEPGWYLMESADPTTADELAFADPERTLLSPRGERIIRLVLERLADLHELTHRPETPAVASYVYLGRFEALPKRSDFQSAFELLVGGDLESFLQTPVRLDDVPLRSYRDQLRFLAGAQHHLVQPVGSYLHGDPHLPNMLLTPDRSGVRMVDPRVVWDGNDVGDPGFGDPLYDLATLFHSVGGMASILHSIDANRSDALLAVDSGDGELVARSGTLDPRDRTAFEWFVDVLQQIYPESVLGPNWQARLRVGVANALLGWLRYPRSIPTRAAWLAVYVLLLHHLEAGRQLLEPTVPDAR